MPLLPYLIPQHLLTHALGALAEVAGPGLSPHIGTVLPALIIAMADEDQVSFLFFSFILFIIIIFFF